MGLGEPRAIFLSSLFDTSKMAMNRAVHHNQTKFVNPTDVGFLCVSKRGHTEDTTDGKTTTKLAVHHNQMKFMNPPDVGYLCVSERGHTEDTTAGLAHLHRNGPHHIPSANSSSSNQCKLSSVISSFKRSHGSRRSRKNKARRSAKKRHK